MELKIGKYTQKELAEWFNISYNSFRVSRDKKFEELKDYADFEIEYSDTKKRIKCIHIKEVYYNTYYKSYKKELIDFIEDQSQWEKILDDGYSNIEILVNYFCYIKGLKYNGNVFHYQMVEVSAITEDTKEKVTQEKRKRNKEEYKLWFYLYDVARKYFYNKHKLDYSSKEGCSVDSYFPLKLKRDTEEMKAEKARIYEKYFGTKYYGEENFEVYDIIISGEDENKTAKDLKEELKQTKMILRLSDKEKREAYYKELMEKGLYPTTGYLMGNHVENKESYNYKTNEIIEAKEGEFNFE